MPQYWICVSNRTNFEIAKKKRIWGASERHKIQWYKMKIGDLLIFYIIKERVIDGLFKVAGDPYNDTRRVFKDGNYPLRVKIEPIYIPDNPVSFGKELRNQVEFIKNKQMWSGYLRRAVMRISETDFNTLTDSLKHSEQ